MAVEGEIMNMVELDGVEKKIDGRSILKGLYLKIRKGERLVLLGPSGCGKTTLLRLVAGFDVPDNGVIRIAGQEVSLNGTILVVPEKRCIGFVFQDLALWPHMNVYENLELGLRAKGVSREKRKKRILEMLEMTDLKGLEKRMPHELSGGQQQRVALARALVTRPDLVLMDEPLSSLDWDLRAVLAKKLCTLQEAMGFTMIYVTHDKEETKQLATRVCVMKKGQIFKVNDS